LGAVWFVSLMLKIIFTIAVVYVIWFAFKNKTRIEAAYKEVQDEKAQEPGATKSKPRQSPGQSVVQDLTPCPKCGAYVAAGAVCSCEKV
jgi:hypothetical protein